MFIMSMGNVREVIALKTQNAEPLSRPTRQIVENNFELNQVAVKQCHKLALEK